MTSPLAPQERPARPTPTAAAPSPAAAVLLLVLLTTLLFALRILGPSNLTDNDQERPAAYVLDAARNGHWMVQVDWTGDITSKPPLYTWLAAALVRLFGGPSLFALYLPCALAVGATAALVWRLCLPTLGPRTALIAAVLLLANPLSAKFVALARTDAVFLCGVTLTAFLVFRAWEQGRGWLPAWLAAALATLTKGPLGIILGFGGLAAAFLERNRGARSPFHRSHWIGAALLLAIGGGWLLLAWREGGDAVFRKLIGAELIGHAVHPSGTRPGIGLVLTPLYFLGRFAPWSALALLGAWQVLRDRRQPQPPSSASRLTLFALAWLAIGLLVLGLASHQRGDLVAPLMPPGAILAAVPISAWTASWSSRRLVTTLAAIGLAIGIGCQIQHAGHARSAFAETRGMVELAGKCRAAGLDPARIHHVDAPYALQWNLGTMQRVLTYDDAARELARDPDVAVAVTDPGRLENALGPTARSLDVVAAWPAEGPAQVLVFRRRPATIPASARP